jgi:polyhydroxybutyrate depolymerase
MRRWIGVAAVAAVAAGGLALRTHAQADARGLAQRGRSYEDHVRVDGRDRTFLVDLPPAYDGRRALPLVVVFHGGGGNGEGTRRQTGMTEVARRNGFVVVYPNGSGRFGERLLTWNVGPCCGYAQARHVDEAAFVRAMLHRLNATLRIDPARTYATGMSNGGMMAYLVGCELADRFAAIAPVSGELTVDECRPRRAISVLAIHGTADEHIPFNGGVGSKALAKHDARSVAYAIDTWRRLDGCPAAPRTDRSGALVHTAYGPCRDGTAVELYAIQGGPHAWPGGQRMARFLDAPSTAMDASSVIWDFFAAHPAR